MRWATCRCAHILLWARRSINAFSFVRSFALLRTRFPLCSHVGIAFSHLWCCCCWTRCCVLSIQLLCLPFATLRAAALIADKASNPNVVHWAEWRGAALRSFVFMLARLSAFGGVSPAWRFVCCCFALASGFEFLFGARLLADAAVPLIFPSNIESRFRWDFTAEYVVIFFFSKTKHTFFLNLCKI